MVVLRGNILTLPLTQKGHRDDPFGDSGDIATTFTLMNGTCLQRLFSTFASGWPGAGLLLLRLTLCAFLLNLLLTEDPVPIERGLAALAALLITIGLWTPIAGVLAASCLVWNAASHHRVWPCLLAAPIGIALSLVGPGAFSLDAYRYGRKRVFFDDSRE